MFDEEDWDASKNDAKTEKLSKILFSDKISDNLKKKGNKRKRKQEGKPKQQTSVKKPRNRKKNRKESDVTKNRNLAKEADKEELASEINEFQKKINRKRKVAEIKEEQPNKPNKVAKTSPKTTTLKSRMTNRLNAARFRFINEQLYTQTGEDSMKMFQEDDEAFHVYHTGFASQVEKWPVNPVDLAIEYIKKGKPNQIVADFGCGDAKIARSVKNKIYSFDLIALNDKITVCDMTKVPLADNSINIAVFCLSLMGTNLSSYILEANRVLANRGTLLIAEVVSRFNNIDAFKRKLEKYGFDLINKKTYKMFVWMELKKTKRVNPGKSLPDIKLSPCLYKKR
ncbi:DgyrCDS8946 [Dimorphilus gyrociliatus]|uniref:Ribosomal RNA-processing protein 8 n=1 Tax=Dimorphilus gyrociliatus TaxID=2664684 RepID=A0A7I8VXY8_9ANNE|nr:DgyrCDS8946 [Dimorphilus gyrociliatus]